MPGITTTCGSFEGGVDPVAGSGKAYLVTLLGNWRSGDRVTLTATDSLTAVSTTFGAGTVTGLQPNFCLTFKDKAYVLDGNAIYFSAIGQPRILNDTNALGRGCVSMGDSYGTAEELVALAPYQGRLAVMSRRTTQIWTVDPDPANYHQDQVLANCGTMAPGSVQSVGDSDVYLLMDSGVRSIRVRDASNNAILADIGTPIDAIIQNVLQGLTEQQKAAACSVVDPSANRYWLFLKDTFYVFSYFPSSGIAAWSTYKPTSSVDGVQVPFTPEKAVVLNGRIYVRATNGKVYIYGGGNNATYDDAVVTWKTPYLDSKTPGTVKQACGLDVGMEGNWTVSLGMDPGSDHLEECYKSADASYWKGRVPVVGYGTHVCLQGVSNGGGYKRFSGAVFHFESGESD